MAGASCSERALCEATRAIESEGPPGAEAEGGAHAHAEADGGEQGEAQGRTGGDERGGGQGKGGPRRVSTKAILEVIPLQCSDYATRFWTKLPQPLISYFLILRWEV